MATAQIMTWDWKEQPDLHDLAQIIQDVYGVTAHFYDADTGSDQFALVVSPIELDRAAVDDAYRRWYYDSDCADLGIEVGP